MIKGILYDKDGTLINLSGPWLSGIITLLYDYSGGDYPIMKQLAAAIGIDIVTRRIIPFSIIAQGTLHHTASAIGAHLPPELARENEAIFQDMMRVDQEADCGVTPLEGTLQTLQQMHTAGMIQGIISNDLDAHIRTTIDRLKIGDYISYTRGSDSGCGHKPAPEMVYQFCDEFTLSPIEVMIVGDSPADMETAQQAGCKHMVGIHQNPSDPTLGHYTPHIIKNLDNLSDIVAKIS